jgi:Ca-activated chloride channel family protein
MQRDQNSLLFGILTLAVGLSLTATASAQQRPTFRSTQIVVPVFITVTDADQRLVTDLDQSDFEVFDNDKLQSIVVFENKPQPVNVVVMLDTSLSMELNLPLLRSASETFLMRLFPQDKAKVGAFNDRVEISREFSSNRDALIAEVHNLDFGNSTRLWDAVDESIDALKEADGRRVILLFTDGADTGSSIGLGRVLDRVRAEEVMVYCIGLESEFGIPPNRIRTKPDGGLKRLAEETGGGYFLLEKTAALGPTFSRVAQELHSQYLLGFRPAVLDNKTHKLLVKLKKPGLTVRARRNYVAKDQTSEDK